MFYAFFLANETTTWTPPVLHPRTDGAADVVVVDDVVASALLLTHTHILNFSPTHTRIHIPIADPPAFPVS